MSFRGLRWVQAGMVCAALALTGCMSPDEDDTLNEVTTLSGTVTGTVLDSNGSPIEGVLVRYTGAVTKAAVSATTNDAGQFELPGVVVSGTSSVGTNDANGPITLVLDTGELEQPHMGATVLVSPDADVIANPGDDPVFIDNFNVDTGPVRLPALNTEVRGTVRNVDTGAAVPGVQVTLEFQGVEFDQDGNVGVAATYDSGANRTATTDDGGLFSFADVYADSCVRVSVGGHEIVTTAASLPSCTELDDEDTDTSSIAFATTNDGGVMDLATVTVDPYPNGDGIPPHVASTDGVVDDSVSPAPLASRIDGVAPNGFVVEFSEPLQAGMDADDALVLIGEAPTQTSVTVAAASVSGSTVTVETDAALPAGERVQLWLAREALLDSAGNIAAPSAEVAYDGLSGDNAYLVLDYRSFSSPDLSPPRALGVAGVADPAMSPATLDDAVTGVVSAPIVISFSEALKDIVEPGDVTVELDTGFASVLTTELVGESQLQIALDEPLPAGSEVTVRIDRGELQDAEGNGIVLSDDLAYDGFTGASAEFFTLFLATTGADDEQAPFVESTDGVIDPAVSPAPLASGIDGTGAGGFVIRFNETLQAGLDASDVTVLVGPSGSQTTVAVATATVSAATVTVETAAAIGPGEQVELRLNRDALRDTSGNVAVLSDEVAYDSFSGSSAELVLSYRTAGAPDTEAPTAASVTGVADPSTRPAELDDVITGLAAAPLTVVFSETMQDIVEPGDVAVQVEGGAVAVSTVELIGGNELQIVLDEALPDSGDVTVLIARTELLDLSGNGIALSDALAYDGFTGPEATLFTLFLTTGEAADEEPPFVESTDGVVDEGVTPAPLESRIDGAAPNGFAIVFNEALQPVLDTGDVIVLVGESGDQASMTVASAGISGDTVSVETAGPIASGQLVEVWLAREALLDTAGNVAVLGAEVAYDGLSGDSAYLVLSYRTAAVPDTGAPMVDGVDGVLDPLRSPAELDASVTGLAAAPLVVQFSEAMQDIIEPGDVTVELDAGVASVLTTELVGDTTLEITLSDALPAGSQVTVRMPQGQLLDVVGNSIDLNDNIAYDGFTGANAQFFTLFLATGGAADDQAPFVETTEGVVDETVDPAPLESRIDGTGANGFVIRFNESLQAGFDAADVIVEVGAGDEQYLADIASVSLMGDTLTVTVMNPIPQSTPVDVLLAREALADPAGNVVVESPEVAYDSINGTSQYLVLAFTTFTPADATAEAPVITGQAATTLFPTDGAHLTTSAMLDTVAADSEDIRVAREPNGAAIGYATALGQTDGLEQLNAPEADAPLNDLLDAIETSTRTVFTGVARVSIATSPNAADYLVRLERTNQPLDVLFFPVYTGSGVPANNGPTSFGALTYVIDDGGASSFDLIIAPRGDEPQPGDVLTITSRAPGGAVGGAATMAMLDVSPPTVSLQLFDELIAGAQGEGTTGGSGSAIVDNGPDTASTVLYSITPQAADVNDAEAGFANDDWKGPDELQGLSNALLETFAGTLGTTAAVGDADGTAAFLQTSPRIGIAVTEQIAPIGAPVTTNVSATLSNLTALNGLVGEDGTTSNVAAFDVDDIFTLQADARDGDAEIALTGAIEDMDANAPDADTRAFVLLRDQTPPLMSLAFYDGTNFVFRFNEPVRATGNIVFQDCDVAGPSTANVTVDLSSTADSNADLTQDVSQSGDGTTFTVQAHVVTDQLGLQAESVCFDLPAYAETSYELGNLGGLTALGSVNPTPTHGVVTYVQVPDTAADAGNGAIDNTWANWAVNGLGITNPRFAMADIRP